MTRNILFILISFLASGCGMVLHNAVGFSSGGGSGSSGASLVSLISGFMTQVGSDTEASSAQVNDTAGLELCFKTYVDTVGNSYCAGITYGALGENAGTNGDAFVIKYDPSGSVTWIRHLGTDTQAASTEVDDVSGVDYCLDVAVDSSGNVFCAGMTTSALNDVANGYDIFVMKLDSSGVIQWVNQIGATVQAASAEVVDISNDQEVHSMVLDGSGNIYLGGQTRGDFGEPRAGTAVGWDLFAMKLDSSGNVVWLSQIGATTEGASAEIVDAGLDENCKGIAVDDSGNVYCGGWTQGDLAETAGAFSIYDLLAVKFDSAGNLLWASQVGSTTQAASSEVVDASAHEYCRAVEVDSSGNVYCPFFTQGSLGETHGGATNDAGVAKWDANGNLVWITQLGADTQTTSDQVNDTSGDDTLTGIALDSSGNIYAGGSTTSSMNDTAVVSDALIVKLDSNGEVVQTFQLGSNSETTYPGVDVSGSESCSDISFDPSDNLYCGGTANANFVETVGAAGVADLIMLKFSFQ